MIGRTYEPVMAAAPPSCIAAQPRRSASTSPPAEMPRASPPMTRPAGFGFEPGAPNRFSVRAARRQLPCHARLRPRSAGVTTRCSPNSAGSCSKISHRQAQDAAAQLHRQRAHRRPRRAAGERTGRHARAPQAARERQSELGRQADARIRGATPQVAALEIEPVDVPDAVPRRRFHRHRPGDRAERELGADAAAVLRAATSPSPITPNPARR